MVIGGFKYCCPSCGHGWDDDNCDNDNCDDEEREEKKEEHDRVWIKRACRLIHATQIKIDQVLENIMSDQAHLDQQVADLTEAINSVVAEILALKNQPPAQALDFTGLDAAVDALQGEAAPDTPPTV